MNRRQWLASSAISAALLSAPARATPSAPRPNILWIVSEDNNPYLGAYGDRLAHTPTLDALAQRSVLYKNAFSNAPVCAPSRFGLLTGVYAESCGPAHNMRANAHLPTLLKTYPEYLRAAGYYCTNNWKTDYNCDVDPARIWNESSMKAHWRNRPAGAPFMSVFNYFTTHESQLLWVTPGRVKPEDVRVPAYLPDSPAVRTDIASYYNLMEKLDGQIAAKLAQLEADGLADDTIIFYYSDNGGVLPRSKHFDYDEGFRTCLMIHVPPKWQALAPAPPGSVVETPVSYVDLFPTLLSLIGQPKPSYMPGRALLGPYAGAPEQLAFGARNRQDERYDFIRTVCDGRYRYIRNYNPHRPWGIRQAFPWQLKSYQDWERSHRDKRLNPAQDRFFHTKPFEEFFDLEQDRDEVKNLIHDPAQASRIAHMRQAMDAHLLEINDNGFIPEGAAIEGYLTSQDRTAYPLPRVMALAAEAARGEPKSLPQFTKALSDPNDIVRYWAALGLLVLGHRARPSLARLQSVAASDPSVHVRIVALEAIAHLGQAGEAVGPLAAIMEDLSRAFPVRLQAINALTFIGEPARAVLPAIRRAAVQDNEYMHDAGRYLVAVMDGVYQPDSPIFDTDYLMAKFGPGMKIGPIPPPI